ncbi:phenylacetic acid degradation-like protein [Mycobacterium xenopi]|uniref:Phenylacetic acid degradation protein n=2 Tax=Mycobacterium xenopi TaxID=1789 RepID=A0AAD1GX95_MYCXE|nr:phenylacetic acid degradation protein [Mycobacterium xenopi]SPX79054.1 phenylacetic acid degradation-like protein [Mycobacterium xenopi]
MTASGCAMSARPEHHGTPQPDIETPDTLLRRFGIDVLDADVASTTAAMSMPIAGMRNPFTGLPTIGPLAILVDAVSGLVNHFRREIGEWTVSSELTLELSPDGGDLASADPEVPVTATGRPLGPRGSSSLSFCTLTCGDVVIGGATVRSYFIPTDDVTLDGPADGLVRTAQTPLAELMAVTIKPTSDGTRVLSQGVDPILNNAIGVINGGVASAGLELAASAAMNSRGGPTMRTASVRVNFLRPFYASEHSRYEAAPLRIGRGTAVTDAVALGDAGKVAVAARVTAYR